MYEDSTSSENNYEKINEYKYRGNYFSISMKRVITKINTHFTVIQLLRHRGKRTVLEHLNFD